MIVLFIYSLLSRASWFAAVSGASSARVLPRVKADYTQSPKIVKANSQRNDICLMLRNVIGPKAIVGRKQTTCRHVVKSGATVKETQNLARHSRPELTFAVYAHITMSDERRAIEKLPALKCLPKQDDQASPSLESA